MVSEKITTMSLLTFHPLLQLDLNKGDLMIPLLDAWENRNVHLKQQLLFAYRIFYLKFTFFKNMLSWFKKLQKKFRKLFLYIETSKFHAEYGFAIKFGPFAFAFQINH